MSYFIVNEKCNGCLACVQNCPADALSSQDTDDKRTLLHNMTRCARCGTCWRVCPQEAIEFQYLMENEWNEVVTLNLLRCRICGETLYTSNFGETLSKKLDQEPEPLCPNHQKALASLVRAHFFPGPAAQREVKK